MALLLAAPFYGQTPSLNYKADKTIALFGNGSYDYAYVDKAIVFDDLVYQNTTPNEVIRLIYFINSRLKITKPE